jgi:protein-L-isoaspartate O-methyltransferase
MAEAGGPDVQVHTIEVDPWHADLAEEQLARRGLSDRVEILRGDAALILPALIEPYDMVFADGGEQGLSTHLKRLTRPGGVPAEVKDKVREPLMNALAKLRGSLGDPGMDENGALAATREEYRAIVRRALKAT